MWAILFVPAIACVLAEMPRAPKAPPHFGVEIFYSERKQPPKISQIDYGYFEEER